MEGIIRIPRFGEIITARPAGMDYDTYRRKLKEQNRRLKMRLSGVWVWKSQYHLSPSYIKEHGTQGYEARGTLVGAAPAVRIG